MQVTYAARNSNYDGLDIKEGDYLALCEDKLLNSNPALEEVINAACEKINEQEKSFISIYYGSDVTEDEAKNTQNLVISKLSKPDIEINLYKGDQPVYYYIISVE